MENHRPAAVVSDTNTTRTRLTAAANATQARRTEIKAKGKAWAEKVTVENAWDRLVLTFDGGGIRGYSSLLILAEIMRKVVEWELKLNDRVIDVNDILPCHYFDYIWGTSTGGLIALMLGRLRMSVPQALEVYRRVGHTIFGQKQRRRLGGLNFVATQYNHLNVKEAVIQITQDHCKIHEPGTCIADDTLLWQDLEDLGVHNGWNLCQAVCVTARAQEKNFQTQPLRSYEYEHPLRLWSPDPNHGIQDLDLLIWEAARATSAAPFYFKMFTKRDRYGTLRRYKDGGVVLNNPAERALTEVRDRHALEGDRKNPAVLLSIGTGIRHNTPFAELDGGEYLNKKRADIPFLQSLKERMAIAKNMLVRYTEGEGIHRSLRDRVGAEHLWYRRLNVDEGLGKMHLGDWRKGNWTNPATGKAELHPGGATLTDMESATKDYLTRTDLHTDNDIEWFLLPSEHIDQIAERLVRHHSERRKLVVTEDERLKWQTYQGRFATGRKMEPWNDDSVDGPYVRTANSETGRKKHSKERSEESSPDLRT